MRKLRGILGVVLLCIGTAATAVGEDYPNKTVHIIVPYPPGGPADVVGRLMAQKLSEALKQPFVIDNRGGAGGTIASEFVARALPNGYTLLLGTATTFAVSPNLFPNLTYDTEKDFAPIALVTSVPLTLVYNIKFPVNSVADLIAYAKARPGKLFYGSAGNGVQTHLAGELLKSIAGIDVVHVPYKGGGPAMIALIAGDIQYMFDVPQTSVSQARSGKIKLVAVTSAKRSPVLPDVPTFGESGLPNFDITAWYAVASPAGTPGEIVTRLSESIRQALTMNDVIGTLANMGSAPTYAGPRELGALIKKDVAMWRTVVKKSGAKLD